MRLGDEREWTWIGPPPQIADPEEIRPAREAAQYATMWDGMVRANGLLTEALATSEELQRELEEGQRVAYRRGYENGQLDAGKAAERRDVTDLTRWAQLAGDVEGTRTDRQSVLR